MSEKIITLNEDAVKTELKDLVRKSVEETLNELLDSEAEELTGAAKYERNESRKDKVQYLSQKENRDKKIDMSLHFW